MSGEGRSNKEQWDNMRQELKEANADAERYLQEMLDMKQSFIVQLQEAREESSQQITQLTRAVEMRQEIIEFERRSYQEKLNDATEQLNQANAQISRKDEELAKRSETINQLRNLGRRYKNLNSDLEAKLRVALGHNLQGTEGL